MSDSMGRPGDASPGGAPPSGGVPFNPNIQYEQLPKLPSLATAHGVLMGLAFVIIFPVGVLALRVARGKTAVWMHVVCQLLGWVMMIGGLATGVRMARIIDMLHNNSHTILGTVVVAALFLQPILGYVHHRLFLKQQRKTAWTHIHVWYGRVLIALGIVNGGLGLNMAKDTPAFRQAGLISYAVLAGVMGILLIGLIVQHEFKLGKTREKVETEG